MNRLRALELEGFQTLKRRVRFELPEITLLYGPNSAGKSAVLDAIELLRIASNIKSFDSRKLFACTDRWASWLSIDRYEDIYAKQRAKKIDPVPIRTCSIAAEFDLAITDPWNIDPSEFSSSLRHLKRSLQFGGDDFVAQLQDFVSTRADGGVARVAMTFSIRGEGTNAFEDDFFCNSIEISLAGKPIAFLVQEPFEKRKRLNPIYGEPLDLLLYNSPFSGFVIPSRFWETKTSREEIAHFQLEGMSDAYTILTRLPQQNYLQLDPAWNDGSDEITKALVECFEDITCYFLGGLQEILSKSPDPVVADRRIPEAQDVSGVVEMRYTKYWWDETAGSATAPVVNLKKRSLFNDPHYRRLAIAAHCQRLIEALDDAEWGSASAKEEIDRFSKMRFANYDLRAEAARFKKVNEYLTSELFRESAYVVQGSSVLLVPLDLSMEDVYHPGYILLQDAEVTLSLRDVNGRKHQFKDVGSGIAFVLPVLVCLTFDGVHFVQQPELHLHPALQSALADVFIDAMRTSQSQTIIETHSEHLLLRLLRRIRRTEQRKEGGFQLLPENVAVYYFDPQVNGESIVTRQFITPLGDFYNDWPRGFFADRDQDLIDGRI